MFCHISYMYCEVSLNPSRPFYCYVIKFDNIRKQQIRLLTDLFWCLRFLLPNDFALYRSDELETFSTAFIVCLSLLLYYIIANVIRGNDWEPGNMFKAAIVCIYRFQIQCVMQWLSFWYCISYVVFRLLF